MSDKTMTTIIEKVYLPKVGSDFHNIKGGASL
jgi:hypothetical protein